MWLCSRGVLGTQGPLSCLQCQTNEMKSQNKTVKNPLYSQLNHLLEGHHFFTCVLFPPFPRLDVVSLLFFLGIEQGLIHTRQQLHH